MTSTNVNNLGALAGATWAEIVQLANYGRAPNSYTRDAEQLSDYDRGVQRGRQEIIEELLNDPDADGFVQRYGHKAAARFCLRVEVPLNDWNVGFLASVAGEDRLSLKQRHYLLKTVAYVLEHGEGSDV